MDLTRLRDVPFRDGGMLTVTPNTAEFFYVVGSTRMSVVRCCCWSPSLRRKRVVASCVGHSADNPLLHTSAIFVCKIERCLKRSQVSSHVKAVMMCTNALGGSCGSSASVTDELSSNGSCHFCVATLDVGI